MFNKYLFELFSSCKSPSVLEIKNYITHLPPPRAALCSWVWLAVNTGLLRGGGDSVTHMEEL